MNDNEAITMVQSERRHRATRGIPPPAEFDIETLPASSLLTALELCAILRRTPGALRRWRRNREHPLRWEYVDGRPLYRVGSVREYLALRSAQK